MKVGLGLAGPALNRDNLIPDHTPSLTCAAPWHAGMAFALGYIKAALTLIEQDPT